MKTKLIRIELAAFNPQNPISIEQQIEDHCVLQSVGGFKLISTFVFGTDLVLVFQKP